MSDARKELGDQLNYKPDEKRRGLFRGSEKREVEGLEKKFVHANVIRDRIQDNMLRMARAMREMIAMAAHPMESSVAGNIKNIMQAYDSGDENFENKPPFEIALDNISIDGREKLLQALTVILSRWGDRELGELNLALAKTRQEGLPYRTDEAERTIFVTLFSPAAGRLGLELIARPQYSDDARAKSQPYSYEFSFRVTDSTDGLIESFQKGQAEKRRIRQENREKDERKERDENNERQEQERIKNEQMIDRAVAQLNPDRIEPMMSSFILEDKNLDPLADYSHGLRVKTNDWKPFYLPDTVSAFSDFMQKLTTGEFGYKREGGNDYILRNDVERYRVAVEISYGKDEGRRVQKVNYFVEADGSKVRDLLTPQKEAIAQAAEAAMIDLMRKADQIKRAQLSTDLKLLVDSIWDHLELFGNRARLRINDKKTFAAFLQEKFMSSYMQNIINVANQPG